MGGIRVTSSNSGTSRKRVSWEMKVNTAIAELSRTLLSRASIKEISSLVLTHAQGLTNSKSGFVGYIDSKSGYLIVPAFFGDVWDTSQIRNKSFVFKEITGLSGWVLTNKKPVLSNRAPEDPCSNGTPSVHLPMERFRV